MPDLILPLKYLVASLLAAAHTLVAATGVDPSSGVAWTAAVVVLVATVRLMLLPLVAHGVRLAAASSRARPAITELRKKYAGRRDPESLQAMAAEQRAIQAEHGMSPLGCLPMLGQIAMIFALYGVLSEVSSGRPVGAMDGDLVASVGSASLWGVRLADRWTDTVAASGSSLPTNLLMVAVLASISAVLSYVTTRWFSLPNMSLTDMPPQLVAVQRMMPALSAVGVLMAAAAVPLGLLVYWVASNGWTCGQQAAICRWWPTPGTPAAQAREARLAR